ncbi:hypothetical protein ACFX1W_041184 [Malus domestica]
MVQQLHEVVAPPPPLEQSSEFLDAMIRKGAVRSPPRSSSLHLFNLHPQQHEQPHPLNSSSSSPKSLRVLRPNFMAVPSVAFEPAQASQLDLWSWLTHKKSAKSPKPNTVFSSSLHGISKAIPRETAPPPARSSTETESTRR